MNKASWILTALVLAWAGSGLGQEKEAENPFFDCPYINYFDSGCPQLQPCGAGSTAPPDGGERVPPASTGEREGEYEWPEEEPELLLPLFPKDSLAPDTPAPYRLLLVRPTLENARRYVRWYSSRMNRISEVQNLIAVAGREFLAERTGRE